MAPPKVGGAIVLPGATYAFWACSGASTARRRSFYTTPNGARLHWTKPILLPIILEPDILLPDILVLPIVLPARHHLCLSCRTSFCLDILPLDILLPAILLPDILPAHHFGIGHFGRGCRLVVGALVWAKTGKAAQATRPNRAMRLRRSVCIGISQYSGVLT